MTPEERQLRELRQQLHDFRDESAQTQFSLLQLENLNDWYRFQINEQNKRILELRGLSKKAKINLFTLTFTVPALEREFRVEYMRTSQCWVDFTFCPIQIGAILHQLFRTVIVVGNIARNSTWRYLFFFVLEAPFWISNIVTMNQTPEQIASGGAAGDFSRAFVLVSENDTKVIPRVVDYPDVTQSTTSLQLALTLLPGVKF